MSAMPRHKTAQCLLHRWYLHLVNEARCALEDVLVVGEEMEQSLTVDDVLQSLGVPRHCIVRH